MTDFKNPLEQSAWQRIDSLCDQFEQSLRSGQSPRISDYLEGTKSAEERKHLLRELISLELELTDPDNATALRLKQDYLFLFPNDGPLITDVFKTFDTERLKNNERFKPQLQKSQLSVGQTFGDYELLEVLGRGGMGIVYRALHQTLKREVALKVTRSGNLATEEEIERFLLEAHTAGQINHSGVVTIHDVGVISDQYFIAMSLIEGQSLAEIVHQGPLDNIRAVEICLEIADAICAIHGTGTIHRDLKPANVLIDQNGHALITDFGLARLVNHDSNMTATGQILGTPSFMAPEQASGQSDAINERTDVYALGATLYCLLTGRPPFQAATLTETLKLVMDAPPVRPSMLNPQVNRDLETICLKCLEKTSDKRYQTAADLLYDLKAYSEGRPISARPLSVTAKIWRWIKRKPVQSALIASLVLLSFSAVTVVSFRNRILTTTQLKQNAEKLADTHKFYANVQKIQNEIVTRKPGWSWRCLAEIKALNLIEEPGQAGLFLRSALLTASTSFDLQPLTTLPVPGNRVPGEKKAAGCLGFSPDGSLLAFGELINGLGPSIAVYSCEDFDQPPRILSWSTMFSSLMKALQSEKKRSDGFRSLAISPNNQFLAAGTRFGKVIVFDLNQANSKPRELEVQDGIEITKVEFSSDGNHLYALGKNTLIKEWEQFREKGTRESNAWDIAVNPAQQLIVWNDHERFYVHTELGAEEFYYHPNSDIRNKLPNTSFLSFSPDGNRLVVVAKDHYLYETRSGRQLGRLTKTNSERKSRIDTSPVFSSDGFYLAQALEDQIVFWESDSGALVQKLPVPKALIDFDPLGRFFVVSDESQIKIYELNQYQQLREHKILDGETPAIATGVNSTLAIARSVFHRHDWAMFLTETLTDQCKQLDEYGVNIRLRHTPWVAISPDGKHSVMSTSRLGAVASQKTVEGWRRRALPHRYGPALKYEVTQNKAISPITMQADLDSTVKVIESLKQSNGESVTRIAIPLERIPPDNQSVFPVLEVDFLNEHPSADEQLEFRDSNSGTIEDSPIAGRYLSRRFPNLICFNTQLKSNLPANCEVVHGDLNEQISPGIKIHSLSLVNTSPADKNGPADKPQLGPFSYSPDSKVLWGIVNEESLWSWDAKTLKILTKWPSLLQHTVLLDIDVGKKWVATCSRNGSVQFSDVISGLYSPDFSSSLHPGKALRNVDLSSDETWCLISGDDGKLERISVKEGKVLQTIHQQTEPYTAQCLSDDDTLIVTGDQSGMCRIWIQRENRYQPLAELPRFNSPIAELCIVPDGNQLAITVKNESCIYLLNINKIIENYQNYGLLPFENN